MLISKTSEQGAGKSWGLSYAGINRGQVQRVFLSLEINLRSTPSLYGCATTLKENVEDCKISQSRHNGKHLVKQMVFIKPIDFKPLFRPP